MQVPQAVVGFPVELFHTCWPCGGVEDVPLLVPGSLVMSRQLTLHVQIGLGCWGGRGRGRAREGGRHTHGIRQSGKEQKAPSHLNKASGELWIVLQVFIPSVSTVEKLFSLFLFFFEPVLSTSGTV